MNTQIHTDMIIPYSAVGIKDVALVGGKNASLGEMAKHLQPLGVNIPDGFATTADAFRQFIKENDLENKLNSLIDSLDKTDFNNLNTVSKEAKNSY